MDDWVLKGAYDFEGRTVGFDVMGEGHPVVLVHGTPWSSFNLRHLIRALAEQFKVHFFDLLGYGQSDMGPGDVSLGVQNHVLTRLLDHWGLERPAAIGHDFGGATLLRTHLLNRREFDRLVLIDPVALSPWGSEFFQHVKEHERAFAGVPDTIHQAIVRAYVKTAAHLPLDERVLDRTVSPWTTEAGKSAFYRQIAQADSAHTDEIEPLYASLMSPVLILWGEQDSWIPPSQGRLLHNRIPNSRFQLIPDAGHLVIEERPDLLLRGIVPFLGGEVDP